MSTHTQQNQTIKKDLKILVPLFTEKSMDIVKDELTKAKSLRELDILADDLMTCPQCSQYYDFCFCDDIYDSSSIPTANYRGVISFKNVLFARHIKHKTTMKQMLNKMRVVPQSLAEIFCGVNEGHFQSIADETRNGLIDFRNIIPKISDSLDGVENIISQINEKMPEIGITIETFNETLGKVGSAGETIHGFSTSSTQYKDFALSALTIASGLYWSFNVTDIKRIGVLICSLIALKYLSSKEFFINVESFVGGMLDRVYSVYIDKFGSNKPAAKIVPEIGVEELDTLSGLLAAGIAATAAVKLDFLSLGSVTKILADSTRSKRGLEDCLKAIVKCFEIVVNFVRNKLFSLPSMRMFDSSSTEIDDFLDELSELHNSDVNGTLPKTVMTYNRIIDFIQRGKVIVKNIPRDKNSEGFLRLVNIELKYLNDMFEIFRNLNFTKQGIRQEPVGVIFQGGAGVGKSITVMHLCNALSAALLSDDEYEEFKASASTKISVHTPETKFWDGYKQGSLITVIDDFGQAVDVPGVPDNEYLKVIRAINSYEYIMHMAKLEAKGTTFFDSKFFLCTTNLVKLKAASIVSNEALNRRFPVRYIISIREEFCTEDTVALDYYKRKIDPKKLPIKQHLGKDYGSLCPQVQIFVPSDEDGNPCGPPISFDDFVQVCIHEHDKRKNWKITQDAEFKATRDKYRSNKVEKPEEEIFFDAESIVPESGASFSNNEPYDVQLEDMEEKLETFDSIGTGSKPENNYICSVISEYSESYIRVAKNLVNEVRDMKVLALAKEKFGFIFAGPLILFHLKMLKYYNQAWIKAVSLGKTLDFLKDHVVNNPHVNMLWGSRRHFNVEQAKSTFQSLKTKIWERIAVLHPIINYVTTFVKSLSWYALIFVCIATFFGLTVGAKIIQLCFSLLGKAYDFVSSAISSYMGVSSVQEEISSESLSKTTMHRPKGATSTYIVDSAKAKALITPQSITDLDKSGYDLMTSVLKKSWYKIEMEDCPDSNNFRLMGACFAVRGRIVLMPYHFVRKFIEGVECVPDNQRVRVRFYKDVGGIKNSVYTYSVADIILGHVTGQLVHNDLTLVRLPESFQVGADRVGNFAFRSDFPQHITNIPFTMRAPKTESDVVFGEFATAVDNIVVHNSSPNCEYQIRTGYRYRGFTNGGDCGAMMVVLDNKQPKRKIFGMHVAGVSDKLVSNGYSYSASVCQEDIVADLALFGEPADNPVKEEGLILAQTDIQFGEGRFHSEGKLDRSPNAVLVTSLRKSKLYGIHGDVDMEPSLLRPVEQEDGTIIDPFEVALTKYCLNKDSDVHDQSLRMATLDLEILVMNMSPGHTPRILKLRDVLDGTDISGMLEGITSSTSAGYPMNLTGNVNLKKNYYSAPAGSDDREVAYNEIEKEVLSFINKLNNGIIPEVVYTDNLKDERRPKAKVRAGKTRLFSGSPFIFLLVVKMYFGDFSLNYQESRIDNESAIGVNPYSNEWDRIARKLNIFGTDANKGAGDYTAYDGSHLPRLQLLILELINGWYEDPSTDHIRRSLFSCITNSVHVYRGIVYDWVGGMPSGNPLTTLLNCLYNSLAFRYCWYRQDPSRPRFQTCVKLLVMGDDNIFSVHPQYRDFNELTLPPLMAEVGLIYTPEDKEALLEQPFRSLEQIEFLKRKFKFEPLVGAFIAPLRFSVIKEMIEWTKKGSEGDKITVENVITALREASLHGKEAYDNYVSLVVNETIRHFPGIQPSEPWIMSHSSRMFEVLNSRTFFL